MVEYDKFMPEDPENQIHQHTEPKQDSHTEGKARPIEDLSLQEYIDLLDRQISSATTPEDIYEVGINDNATVQIQSDNSSRELLDKIAVDMQNPQIFENYEPLPTEKHGHSEEPRRVFLWNSQFVQLKLFRAYGAKNSNLRFVTSTTYPAGYTRENDPSHEENDKEWERQADARLLATTKERATVVNHFLRYCQKNDLRGTLFLNFTGDPRRESEPLWAC